MIGAFFRLAYITACGALVLGLVLLAEWQNPWIAALVGAGGIVAAVVLSEDWEREPAPRKPRVRAGGHRPWRRTAPYEGE